MASGSIGQVYKASINDQDYVIKVRHPDAQTKIYKDLQIIQNILRVFNDYREKKNAIPIDFEEFKHIVQEQTDMKQEAINLKLFTKHFEKFDQQVIFPEIYKDYVSSDILVETYIDAKPITHYIENPHEMNSEITKIAMNIFYRMVFFENFIHSDCHAGNILVQIKKKESMEKNNFEKIQDFIYNDVLKQDQQNKDYEVKVGFIDTGMVVQLGEQTRQRFYRLLWHFIHKNPKECVEQIRLLAENKDQVGSTEELKKDISVVMDNFNLLNSDECHWGKELQELVNIAARFGLKLDGSFAVLVSQIILLEGLARGLDPKVDIVGASLPFLANKNVISLIK